MYHLGRRQTHKGLASPSSLEAESEFQKLGLKWFLLLCFWWWSVYSSQSNPHILEKSKDMKVKSGHSLGWDCVISDQTDMQTPSRQPFGVDYPVSEPVLPLLPHLHAPLQGIQGEHLVGVF